MNERAPSLRPTPALALALVAVTAPVVAEVARKWHSPWRPTGDDALFAIHAHDVFSNHSPMLGTFSVVSEVIGHNTPAVYHLGPMVSWALAIPERFGGARLGIVLGAALVNIAMLVATVVVVRRLSGDTAALGAAALLAVTEWSVGHATLAEPWNPSIGLWALPLVFVLSIALATGARGVAPGALVVVASFAVQAHYLFLGPVAAVVLVATICRIVGRQRLDGRSSFGAALAVVVCWTPTLVQQLTHSPGNLGAWIAVTRAASTQHAPFAAYSLRFVVNTLGLWPAFARGPLGVSGLLALGAAPGVVTWISAIAVLGVGLVGGCAWWPRRRVVAVASLLAVAMVGGATYSVSRYPRTLASFPYYRIAMLWLAGAALWGAVGAQCGRVLQRSQARVRTVAMGCAAGVAIAGATAAVVGATPAGPVELLHARVTHRFVAVALHDIDRHAAYTVAVDGAAASSVRYGLFRELARAGVAVYVPDSEVQLRDHYSVGHRSTAQLVVVSGPVPSTVRGTVLATFDGRSAAMRRAVDRARDTLRSAPSAAAQQAYSGALYGAQQAQFTLVLVPVRSA